MHPIWLAKLWDLLKRMQRERGGQVIVATQSNQLFGLADPGTKVLLGGHGLQ
jgi:predicted ATP-dependent endonuclease of OLD family